jgi:hypothetical protein
MIEQPNFLRLPYKVRLQIYKALWMFQLGCSETGEIFYGEWSPRKQKLVEQAGGRYYFSNQLFCVSRAKSEDARSVFYSGNHLWFRDERRFGFE